jgi:hypothetical protein
VYQSFLNERVTPELFQAILKGLQDQPGSQTKDDWAIAYPHDRHPSVGTGSLGHDWVNGLPWTLAPQPQWPADSQAPDAPSEYIDTGTLQDATSNGFFSTPTAEQETRDVLQMLSALKYLPHDFNSQTATSRRSVEDDSAQQPLQQSEVEVSPSSEQPTLQVERVTPPAEADTAQVDRHAAEGGMVALGRHALEESATESEPRASVKTRLQLPVQMDSVYGKFQAFEVSTSEDISPPVAAPRGEDAPSLGPDSPADAAVEGALESQSGATPPATGVPDELPMSTWTVQGAELPVVPPLVMDEKSTSRLNLGAVLAVAAAASARQASAYEVDRRAYVPAPRRTG